MASWAQRTEKRNFLLSGNLKWDYSNMDFKGTLTGPSLHREEIVRGAEKKEGTREMVNKGS